MAFPLLELANIFGPLIDKLIPDKAKADAARVEMQRALNEIQVKELEHDASVKQSQAQIIVAEAQSESKAARNWRPHLMYLIMLILGYNYLIAPVLGTVFNAFGLQMQIVPIPPDMWTLLTIGVGGYIVGRSGERIVDTYSQGKVDTARAAFDARKFFDLYKQEMNVNNLDQNTVDKLNKILKSSGVL